MTETVNEGSPERSRSRQTWTAFTYVAVGIFQRSVSFLILPLVTRVMSPAEFGQVSVIVTSLSLVGVVFAAAIEVPLFRALARDDNHAHETFAAARFYLLILLPLACIAIALGFGASASVLGFGDGWLWAIELASVGLLSGLTYFGLPVVRARDDLRRYFLVAVSWIACLLLTKLLFLGVVIHGPLGWVTSDLISSSLAWLLAFFFLGPSRARATAGGPTLGSAMRVVTDSLPLIPHRVAFWSLTSLSVPALSIFVSSHEVGIFALAAGLSSACMMLLAELNRAVLLEYSREEIPAPTRRTAGVAQVQVTAAVLLPAAGCCGLIFFGDLVIGPGFEAAIPLTGLLVLGQVLYGVYLVPMNYLVQTAGLFKWSSLASVAGALCIVATIVLGGMLGNLDVVAVGNVAGYAVMMLGAFILLRRLKVAVAWSRCVPASRVLLPALVALAVASTSVRVDSVVSARVMAGIAVVCSLAATLAVARGARAESKVLT